MLMCKTARATLLRALVACTFLCCLPGGAAHAAEVPVIAAASDLKFALDEVLARWREESGQDVRVSYGSSGQFHAQIQQGAPLDIFMSADETLVADLDKRGLTRGPGRLYAIGRVVLFVPRGSRLRADSALDDLAAALSDGRLLHLAIANPAHAPYGRAAREVLEARGLWQRIEGRLVLGENVAQAAQFALGGGAEGGIIALSLALAPSFAAAGDFALLPDTLHRPLRQRMVLLARASPDAAALYEWLDGPEARAILRRYGFVLPDA